MKPVASPCHWLVAHRGWPARYAENSLEGMAAVVEAGARWVELDVQITADGHPVVIHDDRLERLTGSAQQLTRLTRADLETKPILHKDGTPARIPDLAQALDLVAGYPKVRVFVELKRQSIHRHGLEFATRRVVDAMRAAECDGVFISFDARAAGLARKLGAHSIGWVVRCWWPGARWRAHRLTPDYLFIRADRIPQRSNPLWPGPWSWVAYGVSTLQEALSIYQAGIDLVEVDDLPGMVEAAVETG